VAALPADGGLALWLAALLVFLTLLGLLTFPGVCLLRGGGVTSKQAKHQAHERLQ
jgi:hypothetical protein